MTGESATQEPGQLTALRYRRVEERTRWSVSHILPSAFSFLHPPDPPAIESADGGAFGIVKSSSTPVSTVAIVISPGRGTGVRLGFSIAQFKAIFAPSCSGVCQESYGRVGGVEWRCVDVEAGGRSGAQSKHRGGC